MTRRLIHLALGAVLIFGARDAGAQSPAPTADVRAFDTLLVPGGFAALQQAIPTSGRAEDWRTIPVAIELSFSAPDGLRFIRNIDSYAALLRRLYAQAVAVSADRSFSLALREKSRNQVDELLNVLGLKYDEERNVARRSDDRNAAIRSEALKRAGLPMDTLVDRLNAGDTVSLATRDDVAPLPVGAAFWQQRFDPVPPPHDLLWAILSSREMSSLYYALLGFDEETLRAMRDDSRIATQAVRYAVVLPVVVPALCLRAGRVVPAGGPEAAQLWENLVGERLDRPSDFIRSLLSTDEGRLAYFYRTVFVLPAGTASWVLGRGLAGEAQRDRFRRLYAAFSAALGDWRPNGMLQPPTPGPAEVLFNVAIREDGTVAGPPWRDFWRRVFDGDGWVSNPSHQKVRIDVRQSIDPAGLIELVCPQVGCDPERIAAHALLQREFPAPTLEMAPSLFAVARTRLRYPSLALEVERMRLQDPAVYSHLGAVANQLEGIEQPARAVATVQFQSAIALLGRLRAVGAPASGIRERATALGSLAVSDRGFDGGVVRWLAKLFAPTADESVDAVANRRLAGSGWQSPGLPFEWEGVMYRVDIATAEERRLRKMREKFSTNSLDAAVALVRIADAIPEAISAGKTDELLVGLAESTAAVEDVDRVWWPGEPTSFDSFASLPGDVAEAIRRVRPGDRRRIERATQSVRGVADLVVADALSALVYALAIQDPESPFVMSRELPRRHHLHPGGIGGQRASVWLVPQERTLEREMRHISGALLALDAGVPQLAMRRFAASRPDREPNMSAFVAAGLQRTAALTSAWSVAADDLAGIEQARLRGVAIVETWRDPESRERSLTDAGIAGVRAGWLRWSMSRGMSVTDMISLEEMVRLGKWTPSSRFSWGVGSTPSLCLCLTLPAVNWHMRGEPRQPDAAAVTIVEPALRTAVELQRRGLPAALASGVLVLVTTDLIEQSVLPYHSDVSAIVEAIRRIPSQRFDDYVAAVAARGPLVPVSVPAGASQ